MAKRVIDLAALPSNDTEPKTKTAPRAEAVTTARERPKKRNISYEIRNVVNDLFTSLIVPSTKSMLVDFFTSTIQRMILGKDEPRVGSRGLPANRPYHRYYSPARALVGDRPYLQRAAPRMSSVDQDVFFDYEEEARLVLAAMLERVARFGQASLMDFRNLCGLETTPTHHRYIWRDLTGSEIVATSDGWIITLPEMEYS